MKYLLFFTFLVFEGVQERRVYVCESATAYAYHYYKTDKCEGLAKCKSKITETSLDSAVRVFGKDKLCGFCKYKADE